MSMSPPFKVKVMAYTVLACPYQFDSMMCFKSKAMHTNNTNYSCHIKAENLFNQSYRVHITPHHATSY